MHAQPEHVQQPASFLSLLEAMLALRDRIEAESPSLKVLDVCAHPCSLILTVKDTVHDIVVGFSSEADYLTYVGDNAPNRREQSCVDKLARNKPTATLYAAISATTG